MTQAHERIHRARTSSPISRWSCPKCRSGSGSSGSCRKNGRCPGRCQGHSVILSRLSESEKKVYSQNWEDGVIETIFRQIGCTNRYSVEFGCEDATECNTKNSSPDYVARGGCHAAELHRLPKAQGCPIRYSKPDAIGSAGKSGSRPEALVPPAPCPPSARKLLFAFQRPSARDGATGRALFDRRRVDVPGLFKALDLATELAAMIGKTITQPLTVWFADVAECGVHELKTFAVRLEGGQAGGVSGRDRALEQRPSRRPSESAQTH